MTTHSTDNSQNDSPTVLRNALIRLTNEEDTNKLMHLIEQYGYEQRQEGYKKGYIDGGLNG